MTDYTPVTSDSGVLWRRSGSLLEVLVDRADDSNKLRPSTLAALCQALRTAEEDDSVSGLVLRASGPTFLFGGVFSEEGSDSISPMYTPAIGEFYERWQARTFPVLSIVEGPCMAFGCAIALTSDVTIATEAASFRLPELQNGLVPVYAITLMTTRHPMKIIRDLVMTRRPLSALQAHSIHGVTDVVPGSEDAQETADSYTALWDEIGRRVTRQAMETFAAQESADPTTARAYADEGLELLYQRVRSNLSTQGYLDTH
jgi:enoyl-CoA hydratase/carnithine racemase